jgi:hypothetical protein
MKATKKAYIAPFTEIIPIEIENVMGNRGSIFEYGGKNVSSVGESDNQKVEDGHVWGDARQQNIWSRWDE